ncbi:MULTISPECIES: AAA family ATPase [unclassified Rhizobium]|uniref:AAA family ATPase n=1 Tax=unclassified Rhizobium TaxID=2613769 RepID=UPI001C82DFFD|nr:MULTISPECIES: AAA family ATPase [unclassified Rhizobium]MBX5165309.1 AAA family ATPase [Rhizobium sp. NZLR4b]MBX5209019.1 AAA family ATPase [Rhizobium sp. NZLR11]
MIRIPSRPAPILLASSLMRERRQQLYTYLRRPESDRLQRRLPIADELFYAGELRDSVAERCYHKCVFCESRDAGERVEHFRPLRARAIDGSPAWDHYAWLAYEWDNLIYVCSYCARAKEDQFPTGGTRAPYLASLEEVRRLEQPLLIDPYFDAPERHFDLLLDGRCAARTERGQTTIAVLELDSERLCNLRRDDLKQLEHELTSWADDDRSMRLRDIFDRRRPFVGARLNFLKRAVDEITFLGREVRGSRRHHPERLEGLFAHRPEERPRLLEQLDELRNSDEARRVERDFYPSRLAAGKLQSENQRALFHPSSKPRHVGHIAISNLKGITGLKIEGSPESRTRRGAPCLMLLGENGTGKSTLLQGIALALLGGPQARRLRLKADDFLRSKGTDRWDQLTPEAASVNVQFLFGEGRADFLFDNRQRRIVGSDLPATLVLGYGPRRFFDRRHSTAASQPYACVRTLFDPLATIPYPGVWLNSLPDHQFDAVARALRPILALSENDKLVLDADGRICVQVEDRPVPIERLSEGYRSIFALAADIFREMLRHFDDLERAHGVVLIDEVETHLHPRWKMQVMRALRRALPNVQFIVTTHDPLCLRGMEDGEVVVLQRDDAGEITLLENLPSLQGMRAEQLLTSDYFGLSSTIDPETELEMVRFAAAVAERPDEHVTSEIVSRLTLGDSAGEQVIQAALQRFLEAREKPAGGLRPDVRAEAVEAVYKALAAPPRLDATGIREGDPA